MSKKFEINDLKKAFGSFATGVCVATSHSSGFTVNSFASLSLEPPLMIFNIYKTETDYVEFLKEDKFAINFLKTKIDFCLIFREKSKIFAFEIRTCANCCCSILVFAVVWSNKLLMRLKNMFQKKILIID